MCRLSYIYGSNFLELGEDIELFYVVQDFCLVTVPGEIFYDFLPFLKLFFTIILMDSALGQNDHYHCYILANLEGPLRVTAKLTEIVHYHHPPIL